MGLHPRRAVRCLAALFFIALALRGSRLLADGVMAEFKELGKAARMVTSPRQEALLIRDGDKIEVTLRTSFREGPRKLAWIVPVPHKPEAVVEADDAIFTRLEAETTPTFEQIIVHRPSSFGCSAGIGSLGTDSSSAKLGQVVVAQSGKAGIYDYTVLTATGSGALAQWLSEHGYDVPAGSEPIFKQYVDQGWSWLAMQLNAPPASGALLAAHPIRYTYRDTRLVYPMVISRISADETNEVLLYILSNGSYGCENWANRVVLDAKELKPEAGTPSGTNYEKLFQEFTRQEGGHLFAPEFAADLDTVGYRPLLQQLTGKDPLQYTHEEMSVFHLTRLRAIIPREAMDRDVVLIRKEFKSAELWESKHQLVSTESIDWRSAVVAIGWVLAVCYAYLRITRRFFRRAKAKQSGT